MPKAPGSLPTQTSDVLERLLRLAEGHTLTQSQVVDLHWENHNVLVCELTSPVAPRIIAVMRKGRQILGCNTLNDQDFDSTVLQFQCQALARYGADESVLTH